MAVQIRMTDRQGILQLSAVGIVAFAFLGSGRKTPFISLQIKNKASDLTWVSQ
jgi:hypothetical protein